ncbi:AAA family ATPase [Streptomyces sp. NPDC058659]|uniref:helix-turn-helix transcriptional regulator n=1 Tax=unclassified Streptomyces TaxID=2593676 RepID=UPI00364AF5CF
MARHTYATYCLAEEWLSLFLTDPWEEFAVELVEREAPLALLTALAEQARDGHGRAVLVSGAVAAGKSVLVHDFADRALSLGMLPLSALGSRDERHLALGVVRQLVDDAPLDAADRARAAALIEEGVRTARRQGTGEQVDDAIVHGLSTVLLELAERCPLYIAVDDVEQADQASLTCLAYLARRLNSARVLAVFTHSGHGCDTEFRFGADLMRQPNCHRVEVTRVSPAGVRQLIAQHLGEVTADERSADWHAYSGGNPLLVEALVRDHLGGAEAGPRYREAVLSCVRRGCPDMVRALSGYVVLGELDDLDRLVDLSPARTTEAVHALIAGGLLTMDGFRHEAARAAVVGAIDADELARLHSRAAVLAHERGAGTAVVAGHLLHAGAPADGSVLEEPWALPTLEDAAAHALRDGAAGRAVDCLRLARVVCADSLRRARITAALIRAEWSINPGVSSSRLGELVEAMRKGCLRGADALTLARALLWHGRFEQAQEVLGHLADAGQVTDPEAATELQITRRRLRHTYPSFLAALGPRSGAGRPPTHSVSADRRLQAVSALAAVVSDGPHQEAVSVAQRVLHGTRPDELSTETVESALLALAYSGRAERATAWCDLFLDRMRSRHTPSRQARLGAVRAEIALRRGDLTDAQRHASEALATLPAISWGVTVGAPLSTLILATTAMGRYDEAQTYLDHRVPEAMFSTRYGMHYQYARARFGLATGHLEMALEDLLRCGATLRQWGMDTPGLIPWRTDVAEVYLGLGRPDDARRVLEEQSAKFSVMPNRVRGSATRVLAGASAPGHRPTMLRQAAELLQSDDGDRYELALAFADLARAYRTLGEFRRAAAAERRAVIVAADCHAEALVRGLVVESTTALPTPDAGGDGLTEAERRVAAMAAVGCSNREIAEGLHVTVSTVEQHLTRTYRKLRISRRADLPSLLGGPAMEDLTAARRR